MNTNVELGDTVEDVYTQFVGIAVGRTEWLYGCTRIGIEPTELKDGKPIETVWFDEQRVYILSKSPPLINHQRETLRAQAAKYILSNEQQIMAEMNTVDKSNADGGPQNDPVR